MPEPGVAVVTGGGSGIGRATALALARDDLTVVIGDVHREGAEQTVSLLETEGLRGRALEVDVGDLESVRSFAGHVTEAFGVPRVLVNCAGWDETMPFLETDAAFWQRVLAINLLGVVAVTHAFLGAMTADGGGRVVNVASDAGRVGSSGESVYAGAKGGVIAFTKSIAREVARHGVTANVVCPGPTDTPLFRGQPKRLQEALVRAVPMRRLATPEDVAACPNSYAGQFIRSILEYRLEAQSLAG